MIRSCLVALALVIVTAAGAQADTGKCQRAIAKASAQFFQTVAKAKATCEETVVRGGGAACPDARMAAAVTKAEAKLGALIAASCAGSDQVCNADLVDEDLPATLGWPAVCPNVGNAACHQPIHSCADITACLSCLGTEITTATTTLAVGELALPSVTDRILNKCQRTIGKANAGYTIAVDRALARCWHGRMAGNHAGTCEPPAVGDGKYLAAIAKADAKRTAAIGKACGGADRVLGGGDDLTTAAIGFAESCPNAITPGGLACGGAITDLTSLVACLDCVADATVACADRAAVPQLAPYPAECAACLAPPMASACPTTLALTASGPRVDFDLGWNGLGHDATLPSNTGLTLAVSGCDGTHHPTCGECALAGPITGAGGPSDVSRRCAHQTETACATDVDCGGLPCVFFLGPPQGIRAGGVGFCFVNELAAPVSGTLNLTSGSAAASLSMRSRLYPTGFTGQPCPACIAGSCQGGARDGQPCSAQGSGQNGPVSLDCPPSPGAFAGTLAFEFPLSTDVQSRSLTSAGPNCRQTGFTSLECWCDTCNELGMTACFSNADCPASGGGPGICGGRRCVGGSEAGKPCNQCIGGANHGTACADPSACPGGTCPLGCGGVCAGGVNDDAPCTTSSECPGSTCASGVCNRPGETTQPNACYEDVSLPGNPRHCAATGSGEGACTAGPVDDRCSVDSFVICSSTADCVPVAAGGPCADCTTANQICLATPRDCFPDDGTPGNPVLASGAPGPPCDGVSRPTLAAFACAQPVGSSLVNAAFGLPGLSRIRMPVEIAE